MKAKIKCFNVSGMVDAFLDARDITDPDARRILVYKEETRWSRLPSDVVRTLESKFGHSNILIHGDYDADGVCSTAIAVRAFGGMIDYYIPERNIGYGLKHEKIQSITSPTLVVTVDCGINSGDVVEQAPDYVDFVITDHHQPREGLQPQVDVVIDPHTEDYRSLLYSGLSGAEVARLVFESVLGETKAGMQLSAIGTVCDVMPMLGENRAIVREGLQSMRSDPIVPIAALMEAVKVPRSILSEKDLGWRVGPVINAAGRMGHAHLAIELMTTNDRDEADMIVDQMVRLNNTRKRETRNATREALSNKIDLGLCVVSVVPGIRVGLAGLVANRVMGATSKPAIVITDNEGEYVASCRGHHWFSCGGLVDFISDSIKSGGGHHGAAGFSFVESKLDEVIDSIRNYNGTVTKRAPRRYSDIETTPDRAVEGAKRIKSLAPFGHQFGEPVFLSRDIKPTNVRTTRNGYVMFGVGNYEAICYNDSAKSLSNGDTVDIAYTVSAARRPTPSGVILEIQEIDIK